MVRTTTLSCRTWCRVLLSVAFILVAVHMASAQGLNWEGQTGAFITPFAYPSPSPSKGFGTPQVAFHYMNTGSVVGNDMQASFTVGFANRAEIGYTRAIAVDGDTAGLSPLFSSGYNIFHGKIMLVPENVRKSKWVPAIAAGFVARTNVSRVGGVLTGQDTSNGDVYVVATKTITQIKGLPILLSGGVKGTNASLFGMAGNAPEWSARAFGAAAFVTKGPKGSTFVFGSEFAQQPRFIKDLPGATLPTTMTYFVRIVPVADVPLNVDFGVAQAAGEIAPGVNLKARHQFAMGITYRF